MKCEKCNEREANFFYTATINGETTQKRLCSECAAEEGLDKVFAPRQRSMFDSFFTEPFGLLDSFFSRRSMFDSFAPVMTLPRILFAPAQAQQETAQPETEKNIPSDAGEEVKARRELNVLRSQLEEAVKAENFEKAIELRNQIRELEKEKDKD